MNPSRRGLIGMLAGLSGVAAVCISRKAESTRSGDCGDMVYILRWRELSSGALKDGIAHVDDCIRSIEALGGRVVEVESEMTIRKVTAELAFPTIEAAIKQVREWFEPFQTDRSKRRILTNYSIILTRAKQSGFAVQWDLESIMSWDPSEDIGGFLRFDDVLASIPQKGNTILAVHETHDSLSRFEVECAFPTFEEARDFMQYVEKNERWLRDSLRLVRWIEPTTDVHDVTAIGERGDYKTIADWIQAKS